MTRKNEKQITLRIWHFVRHDDATATEVQFENVCRGSDAHTACIQEIRKSGGFWQDASHYVPWHRVNYIEVVGALVEDKSR